MTMRINLTSTQIEELDKTFRQCNAISEVLAQLINDAIHKQVEQETAAWNQLAQLAGFDRLADVYAAGKRLRINWITRELEVEDRNESHNVQGR